MMTKNYTVWVGAKDPTKGGLLKEPGQFTRREANALAEKLRRDEKRVGVYNGNVPRSFF